MAEKQRAATRTRTTVLNGRVFSVILYHIEIIKLKHLVDSFKICYSVVNITASPNFSVELIGLTYLLPR